ncbi:MAG: hypothetical protein ACREAD_08600 [Nitrosopumilaceae archaeon]
MDKVKFFAILIPVLIGLSLRFRILIPVAVAIIVISIVTVILYGNKKKTGRFFNNIRAKEPGKLGCLECGFYHDEYACPKCGSRVKKYYG